MRKLRWEVRKRSRAGAIICTPAPIEPRNAHADPAYANFNLPLPEQHSPCATGNALATHSIAQDVMDVENTPSNDRLRELAANNPPPPQWLEGPEEDLF